MSRFRNILWSGGCSLLLVLAGGCASQSDLDAARANEARLSSQLEQVRTDRDQWQSRYEKLQTEDKTLQTKLSDTEKKLADRDAQLAARKAEIDSLNVKLSDANSQATRLQTNLEAAQKDQAELKVTKEKLADAEKTNAGLTKQVDDLKIKLDAATAAAAKAATTLPSDMK